jgi:putative ABC transport system permease protein
VHRFFVLLARLRGFFGSRRADAEFRRELESHLALAADDQAARGVTPADAERLARVRLGGLAQLLESRREQRGLPQLEMVRQDLRYALRALRRQPAFAAVAIATLGLGIGATTSMFGVLHAVLLRPLPYAAPGRLVEIFETNPLKGWARNVVAPANYADWRRMNTVFTDIAATNGSGDKGEGQFDVFLTGAGDPQRIKALQATGNLFRVLGTAPLLGRTFTDEETYDGHQRVVILSYGLWRSLFGGDPAVVGRDMTLSGRTWTVVGVMPAAFFYPSPDIQIWMPLGYPPKTFVEERRPHWLRTVARLEAGVTIDQARDDMTRVAAALERQYPSTNTQMGVRLEGLHEAFAFDARPALIVLFAAVGTVFLIVCVNVASLQLGRAAGRSRELAIRRALGASRGRLIRQLLTEGAVLSFAGGALGLAIAVAARRLLLSAAGSALPLFADLEIDRAVIAFDAALSLLAPVLFGLAPSFISSREGPATVRAETAGPAERRTRSVLVVSEVALAVALVVSAGLLVRSLLRLQQVDPGFEPAHAIAFRVTLPSARYADDPHQLEAWQEIERRIAAAPGVAAVGAASTLALGGTTWTGDATIEGRPAGEYERELRHEAVTPSYLRALGARLLRGRDLNAFDRAGSTRVMIVNQALATRYFHGDDALGKRITFGRPTDKADWVSIVGVVADIKQDGLDEPVVPEVYVPLAQEVQNPLTFVARTGLEPGTAIAAARAAVRSFDKDLAITDARPLESIVEATLDSQRFRTWLLGGFAGLALFLAALGIYGVLAYFVAERGREIGVRLALGASPAAVFAMVVRQGMRPVAWGAAGGLAAACAAAWLMRSLLFAVAPLDPATYLLTAGILAASGLIACALPALRAVRVDPIVALRQD